MQNTWSHIIIGVVVLILTYLFKLDNQTSLAVATAAVGAAVIIARAIHLHGALTADDKSKLSADGWALLQGFMKWYESSLAKQTGTAPEGSTTTTIPPPTTGN